MQDIGYQREKRRLVMASKELQTVIQIYKSISGPFPEEKSIPEVRTMMEAAVSAMFTPIRDLKYEPVDAGGITAEYVSTPESDEGRVIYYLHGGGYWWGSTKTNRELASRLARAAKSRVFTIDYRLAPEYPFPAAVEDAVAGYRWLLSTDIKSEMVVIAGDSAGAGLAVATMVALKEQGEPLPAAGVFISPWVDLECTGESLVTRADADPVLNRDLLVFPARLYLGETDPRTPLASPIYADLSRLPPLLIQIGTAEVLYDDARRLAEKAKEDGVTVIFEPWEDMVHVWHGFAYMLPEGQEAIDRIGEFVIEHTW
jgi:monoterpene epsilon-lactone hydrolase